MENQSIRIRLKAFDYRLIDASAKLIVDTVKKTGDDIVQSGKNLGVSTLKKVKTVAPKVVQSADDLMKAARPAFKAFYKTGVGKFISKVPLIGPLIDFVILTALFGEDPGRAAFRSAGGGLGAWLGGIAGTAALPIGVLFLVLLP